MFGYDFKLLAFTSETDNLMSQIYCFVSVLAHGTVRLADKCGPDSADKESYSHIKHNQRKKKKMGHFYHWQYFILSFLFVGNLRKKTPEIEILAREMKCL